MTAKFSIALTFATIGWGQSPLTCQATSDPVTIRSEGITERVADVVIRCTGGTPTAAGARIPEINLQIFIAPSINITNRTFPINASDTAMDAALLVDDPSSANQRICVPTAGSLNCPGTAGSPTLPNVFHARPVTANSVVFPAVLFDPPGNARVRTLRIVNVRVNASQLGAPSGVEPQIGLLLSASGGETILPISAPNAIAAIAKRGLTSTPGTGSINRCIGQNTALLDTGPASGMAQSRVEVVEGFANAFKRRSLAIPARYDQTAPPISQDSPATSHETETGYYRGDSAAAGLATTGTLVLVRFANVPSGVSLLVPVTVPLQGGRASGPGGFLRLVQGFLNGDGLAQAASTVFLGNASPTDAAFVPLAGGAGAATYEVMHSDPGMVEFAVIPIALAFRSGTTGPPPGDVSISVTFGTVSTVTTPAGIAPIPRFADAGLSQTLATIAETSSGCSSLPLASPNSITFTAQPGGPAPARQTVVLSAIPITDVNVDAFTVAGGRWLTVSPSFAAATAAGVVLSVQANTTGMSAGEYRGWIRLNAPATAGSFLHVPVTLKLEGPPADGSSGPKLSIDGPFVLPSARVRTAYPGVTLTSSGALGLSPRLSWTAIGLPPGMSIEASTGRISGTPSAAGLFQPRIQVSQIAPGSAAVAAPGIRVLALFVEETPVTGTPAYTVTPAELRFAVSQARPSPAPGFITVSGFPAGQTLRAEVCAIDGRLQLGYPVVTTVAGPGRIDVSVSVRDTPLPGTAPCRSNRAPVADGEAVVGLFDTPAAEVVGEVRIWSVGPTTVIPRKGPVTASVESPDHRVLVRVVQSEQPLLAVPEELTFRFDRTRPDLPPRSRIVPVLSRDLEHRAFTATARIVSPSTVTDWLRVSGPDDLTPATIAVDVVNPERLPPGVYLAMIDYRLVPSTKANAGATSEQSEAKTAVVLKIGPGNAFEFVPGELPITDTSISSIEVSPVYGPRIARRPLIVRAEVANSDINWLTLDNESTIQPGGRILAKVQQRGLPPEFYTGYLTAEMRGTSLNEGAAAVLKVTLKSGDGVRIAPDPPVVDMESAPGGAPSQSVDVHADDDQPNSRTGIQTTKIRGARVDGIAFEPKVQQGDWLTLARLGAATPAQFKVTADTRLLAPGRNYAGAVAIESPAALNPVVLVPVSLAVRGAAPVTTASTRTIPRILNGDGWRTVITVVNPENRKVTTRLSFWSRQGIAGQQTPRALNVLYRGEEAARSFLLLDLEPLGHTTVSTSGRGLLTDDAWASLDQPVQGQIVIRREVTGKPPFEATAPLTDTIPSGAYIFFDNSEGYQTSIAVLNPGTSTGGFQITARSLDGRVLTRCQFGVTAYGRVQGALTGELMQATRGQRGSLEVVTLGVTGNNNCRDEDVFDLTTFVPGGPMSLMGLREHRDGSIAYLAPLVPGDFIDRPGRRIVPFAANGGGWETEYWMMNLEFDSRPLFLDFRRADGDPVEVNTAAGTLSRVTSIAGSQSTVRVLTTRSGPDTLSGWAELPASSSFAGQAFLRHSRPSGEIVETYGAAVQPAKPRWLGYIDQSDGYTNRIFLTNPSGRSVKGTVTVRDQNGQEGRTFSFEVSPNTQQVIDLATRLSVAPGTQTSVEVVADGEILAFGLRSNNQGNLATSFPFN